MSRSTRASVKKAPKEIRFFLSEAATTEIYTLSLHDALPICGAPRRPSGTASGDRPTRGRLRSRVGRDRKSTRLNSSHANISYAVFCLKKKMTDPKHFWNGENFNPYPLLRNGLPLPGPSLALY